MYYATCMDPGTLCLLQMDCFLGDFRKLLVAVLRKAAAIFVYVFFEIFSPDLDAASKLHAGHLPASYLLVDPTPAHAYIRVSKSARIVLGIAPKGTETSLVA